MRINKLYEKNDKGVFDYNLTDVEISGRSGFRDFDGTQKDIVCLGAAGTMGRFVHDPYPSLIENNSEYSVANFGWGGVNEWDYNTPEFVDYINASRCCVYQINSGRSTKNFDETFDLGGTRMSDRGPKLRDLYENNFSDFETKAQKNKKEYLSCAKSFIKQIKVPILFIFVSKYSLEDIDDTKKIPACIHLMSFPQLITKQILDELTQGYDLKCFKQSLSQRLPKDIIDYKPYQDDMMLKRSNYYPYQETHFDIAEYLIPYIKDLLN